MTNSSRLRAILVGCGVAAAASAQPPSDSPATVPQEGFLSSLTQAFKEDFDREVIRGHFDVGAAPDSRRYYCLVDVKNGKREPKAVTGEPVKRPDGMTGIKNTAVSLYGCAAAEQKGMIVTTGYVLLGGAAAAAPPSSAPTPSAPTAAAAPPAPDRPEPKPVADGGFPQTEVSGVRLGMSVEEVRAALKPKQLAEYHESTDRLWSGASASARFLNVIAAWSEAADGATESYRITFTPVPGRERVMAIVHVIAYPSGAGPREAALNQALVRKYGGFGTADEVPAAATWRIRNGGEVLVGDACGRRDLFGASAGTRDPGARLPNPALKTTPDEFRYQLDQCGAAIVTADHSTQNPSAAAVERIVTRLTVSAYSPAIAFAGATAASQSMQAAGADTRTSGVRAADGAQPIL